MMPEGWRSVHLSDVAGQRVERVVPTATDNRPYVALEHLAQGSPVLLGWAEAGAAASAKTAFRTGDVLFGKLRPYLRKAAPAPFDGLCSTDILPLFATSALDTQYLAQLAQWRPLQQHAVATSSGTKMPRTSWAQLGAFSFPLPPFAEQCKIAAILASVDDVIEKTQAVIDQVQVVKRGLMQELLTRGLPGRHTRFKQTDIGKIPEKWRVVRIGQAGIVEAGRQRSPSAQGRPRSYLRVANVYDGYIDTNSLLSMQFTEAEYRRYRLVPGDLLLNEGQSKNLVGRCAQYSGDPQDCCFQNTLVRFRAGHEIATRFAFWMFRHYFYSGVFSGIARQTTSVAHLGVKRFANLKIAMPDLTEQTTITENIEAIGSREDIERVLLSQLRVVKAALMSVLLNGELRITPDTERA